MISLKDKKTKRPPFRLILIKPSKYDDDGYVIRFWRGVLPSNTLSALHSMTKDAISRDCLGDDVEVEMTLLDETAHYVEPEPLIKQHRRGGARVAVLLVGVQTNQFPRAADLAKQFRALGVSVLIGGFHVSGALEMSPDGNTPPELQDLMDHGVTLVKGEVEEAYGDILRDAYEGRLKLLYDIKEKPDIGHAPIPEVATGYLKKFAYPNMGTVDAGRGCPFNCSFCTIINVQGRKMRNRTADAIANHIRENLPKGIDYYFFTDDNFARNKNWSEILDALIHLREDEGLNVTFMMQVDTLAHMIPGFVEKARRAGCTQVFIGLEAVREANLDAAGKRQNKKVDYREMEQAWHGAGIIMHVGYIIGFPDDTPETVAEDIHYIKNDLKIDQASFFMLTPLPGSMDHVNLLKSGAEFDRDYNKYDSFHGVTKHKNMTGEEWRKSYLDAWQSFYTFDHLRDRLREANERTYWGLFKNYVWYKAAIIENTHPMIAGFFRMKDRKTRRPGYTVQSGWTHFKMRARDVAFTAREWVKLYFEMQELWLQTRSGRGRWTGQIDEWKHSLAGLKDRAGAQAAHMQEAAAERLAHLRESAQGRYERLQQNLGSGYDRGRANLAAVSHWAGHKWEERRTMPERLKFWSSRGISTRSGLNAFWRRTSHKLKRGRFYAINPFSVLVNLMRDVRLNFAFAANFLAARTR